MGGEVFFAAALVFVWSFFATETFARAGFFGAAALADGFFFMEAMKNNRGEVRETTDNPPKVQGFLKPENGSGTGYWDRTISNPI